MVTNERFVRVLPSPPRLNRRQLKKAKARSRIENRRNRIYVDRSPEEVARMRTACEMLGIAGVIKEINDYTPKQHAAAWHRFRDRYRLILGGRIRADGTIQEGPEGIMLVDIRWFQAAVCGFDMASDQIRDWWMDLDGWDRFAAVAWSRGCVTPSMRKWCIRRYLQWLREQQ